MRNLRFFFAIVFLFATAGLSISSAASYVRTLCEQNLLPEFAHRPDDEQRGLVTDRVKMSPESLLTALGQGIFPWDITESGEIGWHSPPERGVLLFDKLHISTTDQEFIRKALASGEYTVTVDRAFKEVITECKTMVRWGITPTSAGRRVSLRPWITDEFIANYTELFKRGHAHSVEVWHNGILVAGLYGTYVNGVFGGESMFHKETDAAKLALDHLIKRLQANGHTFIDTQQAIGLVHKWGAELVPRSEFQEISKSEQAKNLPF